MKMQTRTRIDRNSKYFQALGLRAGESRIEVIREAARNRVKQLTERAHPATVDLHKAEIAVAAYRLLDPRGRMELYERIQLSCPIGQEDRLPPAPPPISSINRRIDVAAGKLEADSEAISAPIRIMEGTAVEQALVQIHEANFEDDSTTGDLSIAERRDVVRLLRQLDLPQLQQDDSAANTWNAFGWIRTKLGF